METADLVVTAQRGQSSPSPPPPPPSPIRPGPHSHQHHHHSRASQTEEEEEKIPLGPLHPFVDQCISLLRSSPRFRNLSYRLQQSCSGETTVTVTRDRVAGLLGGMQDPLSLTLTPSGLAFLAVLFRPVQLVDLKLTPAAPSSSSTGDRLDVALLTRLLSQMGGEAGFTFCQGLQPGDFPSDVSLERHGLQLLHHPCPRVQALACPVFWQRLPPPPPPPSPGPDSGGGGGGDLDLSLQLCPFCLKAVADVHLSLKSQGRDVSAVLSLGCRRFLGRRSVRELDAKAEKEEKEEEAGFEPLCVLPQPQAPVNGVNFLPVKSELSVKSAASYNSSVSFAADPVSVSVKGDKHYEEKCHTRSIDRFAFCPMLATPFSNTHEATACEGGKELGIKALVRSTACFATISPGSKTIITTTTTTAAAAAAAATISTLAPIHSVCVMTPSLPAAVPSSPCPRPVTRLLPKGNDPCQPTLSADVRSVRASDVVTCSSGTSSDVTTFTAATSDVTALTAARDGHGPETCVGRGPPKRSTCRNNRVRQTSAGEDADTPGRSARPATGEPETKRSCYRCPVCHQPFSSHTAVRCHVASCRLCHVSCSGKSDSLNSSSSVGEHVLPERRARGRKCEQSTCHARADCDGALVQSRPLEKHGTDVHVTKSDHQQEHWDRFVQKKNGMGCPEEGAVTTTCQRSCTTFQQKKHCEMKEHKKDLCELCAVGPKPCGLQRGFLVRGSRSKPGRKLPAVLGRRQKVVRRILNRVKVCLTEKTQRCRLLSPKSVINEDSPTLQCRPARDMVVSSSIRLSTECSDSDRLATCNWNCATPLSEARVEEEKSQQQCLKDQPSGTLLPHKTTSVNKTGISTSVFQPVSPRHVNAMKSKPGNIRSFQGDSVISSKENQILQALNQRSMDCTVRAGNCMELNGSHTENMAEETPLITHSKLCDASVFLQKENNCLKSFRPCSNTLAMHPSLHAGEHLSLAHSIEMFSDVMTEKVETHTRCVLPSKNQSGQSSRASVEEEADHVSGHYGENREEKSVSSHKKEAEREAKSVLRRGEETLAEENCVPSHDKSTSEENDCVTSGAIPATAKPASRQEEEEEEVAVEKCVSSHEKKTIGAVSSPQPSHSVVLSLSSSITRQHSGASDNTHTDSSDTTHTDSGDNKHTDSSDTTHTDSGDNKHTDSSDTSYTRTSGTSHSHTDTWQSDHISVKHDGTGDVRETELRAREQTLQHKERELRQRELAIGRQSHLVQQLVRGQHSPGLSDPDHAYCGDRSREGSSLIAQQVLATYSALSKMMSPQQALAMYTALSKAMNRKQNGRKPPVSRHTAPKSSSTACTTLHPSTSTAPASDLEQHGQTQHAETVTGSGGGQTTEPQPQERHSVQAPPIQNTGRAFSAAPQTSLPTSATTTVSNITMSLSHSVCNAPSTGQCSLVPHATASPNQHQMSPTSSTDRGPCSTSLPHTVQGMGFLQEMMKMAPKMPASAKCFLPRSEQKTSPSALPARVGVTVNGTGGVLSQMAKSSQGWTACTQQKTTGYMSGGRMTEKVSSPLVRVPIQEMERLLALTNHNDPLKKSRSTPPLHSCERSCQMSGVTETADDVMTPRLSRQSPVSSPSLRPMPPLVAASASNYDASASQASASAHHTPHCCLNTQDSNAADDTRPLDLTINTCSKALGSGLENSGVRSVDTKEPSPNQVRSPRNQSTLNQPFSSPKELGIECQSSTKPPTVNHQPVEIHPVRTSSSQENGTAELQPMTSKQSDHSLLLTDMKKPSHETDMFSSLPSGYVQSSQVCPPADTDSLRLRQVRDRVALHSTEPPYASRLPWERQQAANNLPVCWAPGFCVPPSFVPSCHAPLLLPPLHPPPPPVHPKPQEPAIGVPATGVPATGVPASLFLATGAPRSLFSAPGAPASALPTVNGEMDAADPMKSRRTAARFPWSEGVSPAVSVPPVLWTSTGPHVLPTPSLSWAAPPALPIPAALGPQTYPTFNTSSFAMPSSLHRPPQACPRSPNGCRKPHSNGCGDPKLTRITQQRTPQPSPLKNTKLKGRRRQGVRKERDIDAGEVGRNEGEGEVVAWLREQTQRQQQLLDILRERRRQRRQR
ncbi:uncharacterized protein LOC143297787 [Babylonia areolata]|uniref:uncharacterized protein LOC143297787 n=1 Tax=Babylonia areolata TaxID=304850 RepID=UPI003FD2AEA5